MKPPSRKPDISGQWLLQRPDLVPQVNRFVALLYRLSQTVEAEFRTMAQDRFQLGAGDLRILLALRRIGPSRPTDLFQSLLISSGAVTKQVVRLEAQALVSRQQDPSHKGGWRLKLTARGTKIADQAIEAISRNSRLSSALLAQPPETTLASLDFLQTLLATMDPDQA